jgi:DNA (cytosine-5)-methyltransferase 1
VEILNLYCGIGGNRHLWGDEHNITAVELNEKVAAEYKRRYPNSTNFKKDKR